MLTKFGKYILYRAAATSLYFNNISYEIYKNLDRIPCKDLLGTTYYYATGADYFTTTNYTISNSPYGPTSYISSGPIIIGKGTGTPTEDDYSLFDRLTTSDGLSSQIIPSSYLQYAENGTVVCFEEHYSINNTGAADITITEFGIQMYVSNGKLYSTPTSTSTVGYNRNILISHDVLTTPLVVPAGESSSLCLKFKVDFSDFTYEEES